LFRRLFELLMEGFAPIAEIQTHRARTVRAPDSQDDQVSHA
jgi:hypothetical protein